MNETLGLDPKKWGKSIADEAAKRTNRTKAIVLLSGGQDSTTALAWAVTMFGKENVRALSVMYGQRHASELGAATMISGLAEVKHEILNIPAFGQALKDVSALTGLGDVKDQSTFNAALPASFVPARNALFLTLAAGVMAREHCKDIVTGVCQTDYSGYPDCRRDFIDAAERMLSLALGMVPDQINGINIHTPLMHMTKAETVKLMDRLNCLWWLKYTVTCYEGKTPPCGTCPACVLRAKGFTEAGIADPLIAHEPLPF